MSAWAVVDGDSILSRSILCGEHANQPAILSRVWEAVKEDLPRRARIAGFQVLPDGDAVLAKDCVECARSVTQPDLPAADDAPSPNSPVTTEEDPEQSGWDVEAEEDPAYVREKMDALSPAPHRVDIIDWATVHAEGGEDDFAEPVVELELTVEETVHYPAIVRITKARYEAMLEVFPQLKRHDLPLGLMLNMARAEGARVVVDERHGDVRGQLPVGPVKEGQTWESTK